MRNHLDILRQISELNIHEFMGTLPWWVDGKRQMHGSEHCVDRRTGMTQIKMTLKQALATTLVCERCTRDRTTLTDRQKETLGSATWLGHIEYDIQMLDATPRLNLWGQQLVNWRNFNASQHIRKNLTESNMPDELSVWIDHLMRLTDKHVATPVEHNKLQQEVLHRSAAAVLRRQAHTVAAGTEVTDAGDVWSCFDLTKWKPGSGRVDLANTWLTLLEEGTLPADANETVLGNLTNLGGDDKPNQRITQQQAQTLLLTWTAQYENLTAAAQPVILGIKKLNRRALNDWGRALAISEVLVSAINWVLLNGMGAAVCHPTIAANVADMPWHLGTDRCQYIAEDAGSKDELLRLLTLWEPQNEESVYHKLADAYAASRAL